MSTALALAAIAVLLVIALRRSRTETRRRPFMRASTAVAGLFGALALLFVANLATLGVDYWTMQSGGSTARAYREGDFERLTIFNAWMIAFFGSVCAAALFVRFR